MGPNSCHRYILTTAPNDPLSSFSCFGFFNYKVLLVGLVDSGEIKKGVGAVESFYLENFELKRMIDAKTRVNDNFIGGIVVSIMLAAGINKLKMDSGSKQ